MSKQSALAALAVLCLFGCAPESHRPDDRQAAAVAPSAARAQRPAPALLVGDYRVTLNRTTLDSVVRHLGRGRVLSMIHRGHSEPMVCYQTRGDRPVRIELRSGEMGGGEGVLSYLVVRDGAGRADCALLPLSGDEVRTDAGLRLGMDREDVEEVVGGLDLDDEVVDVWDEQLPGVDATRSAAVRARFSGDTLTSLLVWEVLST